ncbi:GNAT family N-acetyltransferase [Vibrio nomapromontoriensis]|uniref:GNAT family N-acetyltransferase n=1 Tax=Vibrio nomapromontoriensis TaxID=2910246 RepID=UPI003D0F43EE
MDFKIAEYSDYKRIAQLHAESWQLSYKGMMRQSYLDEQALDDKLLIWQARLLNPPFSQHVILAEEQGELLGFICLFGNHSAEFGTIIDNLHVSSSAQRRGVGQTLLSQAMEWAGKYYPDNGVFLEVLADNKDAVHFYESVGGVRALSQRGDSPCGKKVDEFVYTWPTPQELATVSR